MDDLNYLYVRIGPKNRWIEFGRRRVPGQQDEISLLSFRRRCTNGRWYMNVHGRPPCSYDDDRHAVSRMMFYLISRAGFSVHQDDRNGTTTIVDGHGELSYVLSARATKSLKDVYVSPSGVSCLVTFLEKEIGLRNHPFVSSCASRTPCAPSSVPTSFQSIYSGMNHGISHTIDAATQRFLLGTDVYDAVIGCNVL